MAQIINLRRARKAKKRDEASQAAADNRVKFGRSKADKQARSADKTRQKAHLDGHALEREDKD